MSRGKVVECLLSGFKDASGNPLAAGKVFSYEVGSTTPKSLFLDPACTSATAFPLILSAAGTAQVYALGSYKLLIRTASDVDIATYDNLEYTESFISYTPSFTGSGSMTVTPTTIWQSVYKEEGGWVYFMVAASVTIGGTPSNIVYVTLPTTSNNTNTSLCAGPVDNEVGGSARLFSATQCQLQRYDNANWTAGASRFCYVSGWYRRP
jgi:hypothetical protein